MAEPQPAPASLSDLLQRAAAHHRRGELNEAAALYGEVLAREPANFDALHLYGVLMHQRGKPVEALRLIGRALQANTNAPAAYSNHGLVLAVLERHAEALDAYDRAIAIKPDYAEALNNRGNALRGLKRSAEAVESFDRALRLRPDYPEAHNNRGNALMDLDRAGEALAAYERALALHSDYADALVNRGQCLARLGRTQDALASFERALALAPNRADAHAHCGLMLRDLRRHDEALAAYDRALALKPDDIEAVIARGNVYYETRSFAAALREYDRALALRPDFAFGLNNRGNALQALGRHEDAIASFERALALKPDYADARNNRGNALLDLDRAGEALADFDAATADKQRAFALVNRGSALRYLGRFTEAFASFDRALALEPELAAAHWNKALLSLSLGDFENGWTGFEWRWRGATELAPRGFAQPQWRGEDIRGKTILLHAEQGFGDTPQFARYVPLAASRGGKVVLEAPTALLPLLAGLPGAVQLVARGDALPPFDLHCPLMSLPLAFGTKLETIPAQVPYLSPPAERLERWRARLPAGRRRVGLAWSGKPSHKNDRNRSIPLASLAPALRQPDAALVSLQREYRENDLAELARWPITRCDDALADFADTAAIIANLDLVVAVDTAVAHLAGALGKRVFVLLPHAPDWRWLLERADSPWYPTARLFRQPAPGDWGSVITALSRTLATGE